MADSSGFLYSQEEIQEIQGKIISDPVDFQKVGANLKKASSIISETNKDLIDSAQVDVGQYSLPFIYKMIEMNMSATFNLPNFSSLKVSAYNSDRMGLFLLNRIDSLGFQVKAELNGYENLKKSIIDLETWNWGEKSVEGLIGILEYKMSHSDGSKDHSQLEYEFVLGVIRSMEFSQFLEIAEPLLAKVKRLADQELAKNLGNETLSRALISVNYKVCNGFSLLKGCWSSTPSVMIRLSGNTYILGNAQLELLVTADQIKLDGNASLGRQQVALLTEKLMNGTFAVDIMSYKVLKEIENASDEEIETTATKISRDLKKISDRVVKTMPGHPTETDTLL